MKEAKRTIMWKLGNACDGPFTWFMLWELLLKPILVHFTIHLKSLTQHRTFKIQMISCLSMNLRYNLEFSAHPENTSNVVETTKRPPKVVCVVKVVSLNFHCQFPFCYRGCFLRSRRSSSSYSINPIDFSTRRCATKSNSSGFSTLIN